MLAIETFKAIWQAAKTGYTPSAGQTEVAVAWLSRAFEQAVQRAAQKGVEIPLTRKDVDRLKGAYSRFRSVIESLQDRDYPPPTIPVTDGATDWEYWIGSTNGAIKRGRDATYDWSLIEDLLRLYEAATNRRASGADERGPTLAFLDAAFEAFADMADPAVRSYFQSPSLDALRRELPGIRGAWNDIPHRKLKDFRRL